MIITKKNPLVAMTLSSSGVLFLQRLWIYWPRHQTASVSFRDSPTNKMLIGKAYSKNILEKHDYPKLLHGTGVMTFSAKEIGELQVQENAAYRRNWMSEEEIPQ